MKKFLGLFLLLILTANISAFADGIEVQPTMYSRSNAQDRVWVGTFQLVWNNFIDKIVHNPVRFREGTPIIVHELNRQTFTENDLSDKSYYTYVGKVTKNTKRDITRAIKRKFKETSDLLDKFSFEPRNDKYFIYAMLKKDFEFINAFNKLGKSVFGEDDTAEYFGIDKKSDNSLCKGVRVLFYNSHKDYAVALKTKDNEEVFLYKNSANKPFNYLYADMLKKEKSFNGETEFRDIDELKIPNIKFFAEKTFDELAGKRVMGTNLVIDKAMETVKFNMNNKGVELKSEAAMSVMTCSLPDPDKVVPRMFFFDDTFVIFLKEKKSQNPYFALRVNDIKKFQAD